MEERTLPKSYFTDVAPVADIEDETADDQESWRSRERKMKTLNVGLVMCLNIGVDPPDVIKTNPCSKLLCWLDPTTAEASKVIEEIGSRMAEQYKRWQPKIKCKQALDPTLDDVKRICCSMRRRAKDEPVLFHYNGLGVPRPTQNGELWVFNRSYTQYLPLSVYDLQSWLQSPSVYVYDCNGAGVVIENFLNFVEQRRKEHDAGGAAAGAAGWSPGLEDCIQLAACGPSENLPTLPALPADLFTSCLTTPIETSLRWAYASSRKHLLTRLKPEMIDLTPGQLNDRRTMLGQLNWIFTAITDTIAWNTLPPKVFHKLFRNDLLVAALFRNFLLADRIMRSYGCKPVSHPKLPETHNHPLWAAWDLASDMCVAQLPDILEGDADFEPSPFFSDQLTAFEVWLSMQPPDGPQEPPEQLPIVLQVLLSQQHRLRALQLLERFLSLGSWAVRKALSVGIFPYVFKLLGSPSTTLRPVLISLWAKILAEDSKCKVDLLKSAASPVRSRSAGSGNWKAYNYFVSTVIDVKNEPRLRAMAAFVLAIFADDHPKGQNSCIDAGLIESVIPQLKAAVHDPAPEQEALRVWLCMALAKTWVCNGVGRTIALENGAVEALAQLLSDPLPRVRAVAVYALGQLIGVSDYSRPDVVMALSNYERYHGLKPGNATIAQVAATSAGVNGWAQHLSGAEDGSFILPHAAGPGDADPAIPSRLWTIFGRGIGLELMHCLEDGSHAVRLEAAYALTALVAYFKEDFARVAGKQKPYPAARSEMQRILVTQLLLAADPVFAVGAPSIFSLKSINVRTDIRGSSKKGDHLDRLVLSGVSPRRPKDLDESVGDRTVPGADTEPAQAASAPPSGMVPIPGGSLSPDVRDRLLSMESLAAFSIGSLPFPGGHFVWHKAGIAVVAEGETPRVTESREAVEEIILKIAELEARGLYPDDADMQDALCQLYDHILDATESSSAVETELQRAGWNAADFLHGGLERFTDLAARLQDATEMSPEMRSKTALMPWYQQSVDSCNGEVQEAVDVANARDWREEMYARRRAEAAEYARRIETEGLKFKMDDVVFHSPTKETTHYIKFHPREPCIVLGNKKTGRMVSWDTEKLVETASWLNGPSTSSDGDVTSVILVNEHDDPLLAVGTGNGQVRLWSGWADPARKEPELRTGWRAVHKLKDPRGKGAKLILGWNQSGGRLYAGGDVFNSGMATVQVWDARTESRCQKLETGVKAPLTSICVLPDSDGLVGMGFMNGHVCLSDPRLPPDQCVVQKYEQHKSRVVNVHLQLLNRNHIMSGSEAGDILWWDPRFPGQAVRNLMAYNKDEKLTSMVVHDYHSLIATATRDKYTKIFNLDGEMLDHHRGKLNFVGDPFGPSMCLAFHQFDPVLGTASREKVVTLFKADARFAGK
eukprot:CAMPEP_0206296148 /NCGR_PEP_ID=MMETSP0106_2-20121207/5523_1 /ASSEMBLY_ACC=CAM_ASM_000206 /TAXON_ID=81532 /ORGANISM="Acanthoeca-like sp., Strain 10tr" /LENGTH=1396 /DNA_ID=CAMNT_0053726805 /DNA_START=135 /DNA_END=4325 /DNA_ORIENTATION=-